MYRIHRSREWEAKRPHAYVRGCIGPGLVLMLAGLKAYWLASDPVSVP